MIVFIDESGDPGFKTQKGSSSHFVIALIIFQEELTAEETALVIKRLRKELGHSQNFEFKFNKSNKDHRIAFLKAVNMCHFHIRAIIVEKEKLYSKYLRENKENFYNFALKQVLEHNSGTIKDAKIRLDGRGERIFRQQLSTYLRRSLNSQTKHVMHNLRFRDSKQDVLIQLADMVAGSLHRYYNHKGDDWKVYRKLIQKKEQDIWEFK